MPEKDFLHDESSWLNFVCCLSEDNADKLAEFRDSLGPSEWAAFLTSCDHKGARARDNDLSDPEEDDASPFPTNPFFAAMFYNSQRCLRLMHEAAGKDGVDFAQLTERGFTAYHMLLSALRFMSDVQRTDQQTDRSTGRDLIELFHRCLFTRQQQAEMLQVSSRGMAPMSWGVFLGLAGHVEYIMLHHIASGDVQSDSVGIRERVSVDVTDWFGENPAFFTSPICVLLDVYSQATLAELKAAGVFRNGFLWRRWVEALYHRNRWTIRAIVFFIFAQAVTTVVYSGPGVNHYLRSKCHRKQEQMPEASSFGILVMLLFWFFGSLPGVLFAEAGLFRKERYRRQVGYPSWPRSSYIDLLPWLVPCIVSLPTAAFLMWVYIDTERCCEVFDKLIYPATGCAIKILLLTVINLIVWFMRLVAPISTMMSGFHHGLMTFTMFMAFYLVLTGIFARMFQGSDPVFISTNLTTNFSESGGETLTDYIRSFYTTFLVSLNIVDTSIYMPDIDRVDLLITHVTYVLFVPILFINFVVGVLSSAVNHVIEHDVESRYLNMLTVVEILERDYSCIRSLFNRLFGRCFGKPKRIRISGFLPITGGSRLFSCRAASSAGQSSSNERQVIRDEGSVSINRTCRNATALPDVE